MNRLTIFADKIQTMIDAGGKDGALNTPEKIAAFEAKQNLTAEDHAAYQTAKSLAQVHGVITAEEATTAYQALGACYRETGWAKGTSLGMKIAVTKMIGELLAARTGKRVA